METRSIKTPGDLLKMLLRQRGWTQEELSLVIGRSVKSISDVARGRSSVTPEMAACLAAAFGNTAEEWMQADTNYRLSLVEVDSLQIEERAKIYGRAPVREMDGGDGSRPPMTSRNYALNLTVFSGLIMRWAIRCRWRLAGLPRFHRR